jgi:hypothetical protein
MKPQVCQCVGDVCQRSRNARMSTAGLLAGKRLGQWQAFTAPQILLSCSRLQQHVCLLRRVLLHVCVPAGETVYFPCSAWLGAAKGAAELSLLGSRANPREGQREVARLRQQVEAANAQLAGAQAELAAARSSASGAQQAQRGHEAELEARLAALQAEVQQLRQLLQEAQRRAAAAKARVEQVLSDLSRAEERASSLRREQETRQERAGADANRAAELAAQLKALQDELAAAQEAAAAAGARARQFQAEARRTEEALEELRSQHERLRRDSHARCQPYIQHHAALGRALPGC